MAIRAGGNRSGSRAVSASMRPATTPRFALAAAAAAVALLAGCGGSDEGTGSRERPAPDPSEFPAANGRPLGQILSAATGEGPVVSPAAQVLRLGENRFPFGVFTVGREQITDAKVAIYAAPGAGLKGPAIGPFTARIEDLTTEPAFRAESTAADPDAAQVAYVAEIPLERPGPWTFGALTKEGDTYTGSLLPTPGKVGEFNPPNAGEPAPRISTPTSDDVADISEIDTREPPDTMHDTDLAEVLGKQPAVLLFATPALCQSRVCGPVVDAAEQVKREFGDRVAFIHQEVYVDNDLNKGPRPQMKAYDLPSEPWLFVIDRDGRVSTAIEGPFSVSELEDAVRKVAG
jgi:hypothetical protein